MPRFHAYVDRFLNPKCCIYKLIDIIIEVDFSVGYHFTATGTPAPKDICGNMEDLAEVEKSGVHGSGLTLDFRSNRINTGEGFFLALICTLPSAAGGSRRKRDSDNPLSSSSVDGVVIKPACTPSQTLTAVVGRDSQDEPLKTADEFFVSSL